MKPSKTKLDAILKACSKSWDIPVSQLKKEHRAGLLDIHMINNRSYEVNHRMRDGLVVVLEEGF